jgi:transcriptional regulator with XRE-family HTH domain
MSDFITLPAPLATVVASLRARNGVMVSIDPPAQGAGEYYVDVAWPGGGATICWRLGHGFELSSVDPAATFGQGHDETYEDSRTLLARIDRLVEGAVTWPSIGPWLGELRRAAGLSQQELAERLGVSQSAVAQQEKRADVSVSVLVKTCAASNGRLSMSAQVGSQRLSWGPSEEIGAKRTLSSIALVPSDGAAATLENVLELEPLAPLRSSLGAKRPPTTAVVRKLDDNPATLECA